MNGMRQTAAITAINLQSIPQRIGTSLVICVGIAGVVAVLTTVLAMATGLKSTLANAARDRSRDRARQRLAGRSAQFDFARQSRRDRGGARESSAATTASWRCRPRCCCR